MWAAVPAAVFAFSIVLVFATPTACIILTRRLEGKLFIEVRLFGLGFTFTIDRNQHVEAKRLNAPIVEN